MKTLPTTLIFSVILFSGQPLPATIYQITDLETLPGGGASRPYGINDSAQVVGARFHERRPAA